MKTGEKNPWSSLLKCPVTHGPLVELDNNGIALINRRIRDGELNYLNGAPVKGEIEAGFESECRSYAYMAIDGILFLLPDQAMVLGEKARDFGSGAGLNPEKKVVRDFYDNFGWQKGKAGKYFDTDKFVDQRPLLSDYYRRCDRRAHRLLREEGSFFLDVASGPIADTGLLHYSRGFSCRICVDLSVLALEEARRKLGEGGIYIHGDVTNLPLRDNSVDAVLSMHTIYHVPAAEQAKALREIHRVLKPDASGVVVYTWGGMSPPMRFMRALKAVLVKAPLRAFRFFAAKAGAGSTDGVNESDLYFHAHQYQWFQQQGFGFHYEIRGYMFMNKAMLETFIHERLGGKQLLRMVSWFEDRFPRLAGRLGEYPMIWILKKGRADP